MSDVESAETDVAARRSWMTRGGSASGAASFFSDAGHEITAAVLPSFVTSTLRGRPARSA